MISFPCKCGQPLEVPVDQAGLTVQCPKCGLLADVPTLSDLKHISQDGTYTIEPAAEQPTHEHRIEDLRRAFSHVRTDDEGDEIDLRPTMTDVKKAGFVEEPQDDTIPLLPKYDPVTGELLEPIKLQAPAQAQLSAKEIPMAHRVVSYAAPQQQSTHQSSTKIFLELCEPTNIIVMGMILIMHFVWEALAMIVSNPFFFIFLIPLIALSAAFFAHYGIVIEEIGWEGRDELPRPLRHMEIGSDFWWPFIHFGGALLICFGAAFYELIKLRFVYPSPMAWPIFLLLCVPGCIFFPAIALTLTTSGSQWNLRPDRVIRVMIECGSRYVVAALIFPIAATIYFVGTAGGHAIVLFHSLGHPGVEHWIEKPAIVYPLLITGIYLMHYFCWYLGLMYRDFHDQFPWILQRHIPTRLLERTRT